MIYCKAIKYSVSSEKNLNRKEIEEVIIPPNAIDEEKIVWVKREKSFDKFSKGKEK